MNQQSAISNRKSLSKKLQVFTTLLVFVSASFSSPVNAYFIVNDYFTPTGLVSSTDVYHAGFTFANHGGSMDIGIGSGFINYGVRTYFSYEDSPERKQCLRESNHQKLWCDVGKITVATVTEIGILALGLSTFWAAGAGGYIVGLGTAVNAGLLQSELSKCENERDNREIECPV